MWRKAAGPTGDVESGHGRRGGFGPGAAGRHRAGAAGGSAEAAGEGRRGRPPGCGGGPGSREGALTPPGVGPFAMAAGPPSP